MSTQKKTLIDQFIADVERLFRANALQAVQATLQGLGGLGSAQVGVGLGGGGAASADRRRAGRGGGRRRGRPAKAAASAGASAAKAPKPRKPGRMGRRTPAEIEATTH